MLDMRFHALNDGVVGQKRVFYFESRGVKFGFAVYRVKIKDVCFWHHSLPDEHILGRFAHVEPVEVVEVAVEVH